MKKIVVVHASSFDFVNELHNPLRESGLNSEYDFLLPQEYGRGEVLTKEIIQNCDVVVAEVSYPSTGAGIELGWADVFGKPIVCMYRQGTTPSRSLRHITNISIEYTGVEDMLAKLAATLQEMFSVHD